MATMTHRAAFLIPSAHHSALCKNAAKSCICHRSAKSACKSFSCHTSKNALPQVLCLPHLRHPPGGAQTGFESRLSNFSAPAKASISQSFLTKKIGSVILSPSEGNSHREQTAHLHRAIPEHRAARLGLHQRAAPGEVRPVFHRARAMRRRFARGLRGHGKRQVVLPLERPVGEAP